MWLFLATEIMFFTGLIGTYIVLRSGSPPTGFSNIFPPAAPEASEGGSVGVVPSVALEADERRFVGLHISKAGSDPEAVTRLVRPVFERFGNYDEHDLEHLVSEGHAIVPGQPPEEAEALAEQLRAAGATVEEEFLKPHSWPLPYDDHVNPLSIDLTAFNTFILICSSVTMVLALAAIQKGNQGRMRLFLLATIMIGSVFLGIQVYEYWSLMQGHVYPIGISADGHFRPSSSLFASCFFTMTGFHGAHVAGGIVMMICLLLASLKKNHYTKEKHSSVELIGLYWHFVDLVWILLFTVVYLI